MRKYKLTQTTSRCPKCNHTVRLLSDEWGPAFYLCQCGFVGQLGVGPVEEE